MAGKKAGLALADKIMRRVRAKGRGKWVCTAKDFLDLGNRAAVDKALSRLAKGGTLRRAGRGLYDLPRMSSILGGPAPVSIDAAVAAVVRRDGIRILPNGMKAANGLGLTTAVPAKIHYITDGATRTLKIDSRTVRFTHADPKVMAWAGRPSALVMLALRWLGPLAIQDKRVLPTLKNRLPDRIKQDFIKNAADLPSWAAFVARGLAEGAGVAR